MGKTILLSSHILSELQEICSRVGILERGQLVAQGTIEEVVEAAQDEVEVWVRTPDDARAAVVLRELAEVHDAEHDEEHKRVVVRATLDCDLARLSSHLHARDLPVRHLERRVPTLEQAFMKLTQGLVQ